MFAREDICWLRKMEDRRDFSTLVPSVFQGYTRHLNPRLLNLRNLISWCIHEKSIHRVNSLNYSRSPQKLARLLASFFSTGSLVGKRRAFVSDFMSFLSLPPPLPLFHPFSLSPSLSLVSLFPLRTSSFKYADSAAGYPG